MHEYEPTLEPLPDIHGAELLETLLEDRGLKLQALAPTAFFSYLADNRSAAAFSQQCNPFQWTGGNGLSPQLSKVIALSGK